MEARRYGLKRKVVRHVELFLTKPSHGSVDSDLNRFGETASACGPATTSTDIDYKTKFHTSAENEGNQNEK